jgi:hypothetical protein
MAQLTFGISTGELTLTVMVGHCHKDLAALKASGGPLPMPLWATGVVDTGSTASCVAPALLQRLGIPSAGQGTSHTTAGSASVNLFEVSLSIPPAANAQGSMLTRDNLLVMEMPSTIPGVEVLIGLDILLDCKLLLDGPGRQFTLEF